MSDTTVSQGRLHCWSPVRRSVAVLLLAAGLAGCTSSGASPSPAGSAGPSSDASASTTPTETPLLTPSAAVDSPLTTIVPTATPAPATPVPAVEWTALDWLSIPAASIPKVPGDEGWLENFDLYGWSGGFIDFVHAPNTKAITAWSSADGRKWTLGKALDTAGLTSQFDGTDYSAMVSSVAEGPAGLIAAGQLEPTGIACGPSEWPVQSMWQSTNGASWTRLDIAAAFGKATVYKIWGGTNAYIARGTISDKVAFWTSTDGHVWKQSNTGGSTFSKAGLGSAASVSGGFVIAGTTELSGAGCAPGDSPKYTGALWWSADGTSWTRDGLTGSTTGESARMSVYRINDHALYATEQSWTQVGDTSVSTDTAWTSTNGKTWTLAKNAAPSGAQFFSNGTHAILANGPSDGLGLTYWTFDSNLKPVKLTTRGSGPGDSWWPTAMGPTGLLVASSDGTKLWLGVPAAK